MRGHVAVTDLADYGLELPVDSDAYNSIGGFVFAELGRLPRRGDTVNADGYSIRVESVRENRIEAVRIRERRPRRRARSARRPDRGTSGLEGGATPVLHSCLALAVGATAWRAEAGGRTEGRRRRGGRARQRGRCCAERGRLLGAELGRLV